MQRVCKTETWEIKLEDLFGVALGKACVIGLKSLDQSLLELWGEDSSGTHGGGKIWWD